jgi:hypothetical protein
MEHKVQKLIETLLEFGNPSPKAIVALCEDFGFSRKVAQLTIQRGFDAGHWHLDENMNLSQGSLWDRTE